MVVHLVLGTCKKKFSLEIVINLILEIIKVLFGFLFNLFYCSVFVWRFILYKETGASIELNLYGFKKDATDFQLICSVLGSLSRLCTLEITLSCACSLENTVTSHLEMNRLVF